MKKLLAVVLVSILLFSCFLVVNVSNVEAQGWLTGWNYRKSHVINPASGAGTNYQVRIVAHYGSGTDSGMDVYLNGHCRTDFGDVRFTKSDGVTLLNYWMESKVDSDNAVFWVQIADDLSTNPVTIYIYYGKSDATTTSNGDATFLFFDDFPGTSLDTTKWTNLGGGTVSVSNSILTLQGSGTKRGKIGSASFQSSEYCAIRTKVKVADANASATGSGLLTVIQHDKSYGGTYDKPSNGFFGSAWAQVNKRIEKGVSNTVTYLAYDYTSVIFPDTTNWYQHEIRKAGSTLKYWWNGDVILTASDTTTFTYKYVGLASRETGAATYIDWVFVRKYVDPEPSHGSWGSEETAKVWRDVENWLVNFLTMSWRDVEVYFVKLWTMMWRNVEEWSFQFIVLVCHTIEEWFVKFWTLEAIYIPTIKWGMVFGLAVVFAVVLALMFEEGKKK
jgi:hypothetical protein